MSDKAPTAPDVRNEPKGGAIIADRYRVDRLIARGGMAAVYLAHQVKLNRPVALKVLSPPADAEEGSAFEERFRLEAETLASLDHPNIVILHDFGDLEDGRFFLAMEFIDGPRLSDLLRDGPLPPDRALHLILQVCSGLRYAHKRGVVHRDLKPSNLLVKPMDDGTEQLKVVDFGLVKLTERDQAITRAGLILGSPHCMAPEQVKGLDVDHRADIYAIGVLLFRCLTGHYPFHGPNSAATMIAHLNQPIPTFFSVAPEIVVPAGTEEIVRRCLAKSPADRYPDIKELMDDLAGLLDVPPDQFRSVSQTHASIERTRSPSTGRGGGLLALLALASVVMVGAALGVALVAGGLLSQRSGGSDPARLAPDGVEEPEAVVDPALDEPVDEPVDEALPDEEAVDEPAGDEPIEEPEPEEPVPAPAPAPVVPKPAPEQVVPKPAPEQVVPKPKPKPKPKPVVKPEPAPEPATDAPDGYMGLPEDLFD